MTGVVRQLTADEISAVRPLADSYPYLFNGQYQYDVRHDSLVDVYLQRLQRKLTSEAISAHVWWESGKAHALTTLEQLAWDTEHFGVPIVRLEFVRDPGVELPVLQELIRVCLRRCAEENVAHVSARVPVSLANLQKALAGCGFEPVGVKLMLRTDGKKPALPPRGSEARYCTAAPEDFTRVYALAATAITDSRFHRDGRFDPERVAAMYVNWVEQESKKNAEHTVVAWLGDEIVGYLTYEIGIGLYDLKPDELGDIDVGFVASVTVLDHARGRGIGNGLLNEGARRMWDMGCTVVFANVMLSNPASVNAFLAAGFTLMGSMQEFHAWL